MDSSHQTSKCPVLPVVCVLMKDSYSTVAHVIFRFAFQKKKSGFLHPKNAWTLQWKGWNLYGRGPVPQNSRFLRGRAFIMQDLFQLG